MAQWNNDADMGHGFFVPIVAAYIVWQRREEILAIPPKPNWWGLAVVVWGALQLWLGTLAAGALPNPHFLCHHADRGGMAARRQPDSAQARIPAVSVLFHDSHPRDHL